MNIQMHAHSHEGPPVILIHGFPGGASDWNAVATALSASHTVTSVDLLGFGDSDRPKSFADLWIDSQVESIARSMRRALIERATVAAHDFGVPVAVTLADRHPDLVHALVLTAGNVLADPPVAPPMRLLGRRVIGPLVGRALFSRAANRWMANHHTSGATRARPNDPNELDSIALIFGTALTDLPGAFGPVEAAAKRLTVPVHVVWGAEDPFFPVTFAQRVAATVDGDLTVVGGVGHFPHIERPEAVAAAVAQFTPL